MERGEDMESNALGDTFKHKVVSKRTVDCLGHELLSFVRLLKYNTGQNWSIEDLLTKTHRLFFLYLDEKCDPEYEYFELAGVMAVRSDYRRAETVFNKAQYELPKGIFIGFYNEWSLLTIASSYRDKGYSKLLRDEVDIMTKHKYHHIYSVVEVDNLKVNRTNARYGFKKVGLPFTQDDSDKVFELFLKEVKND